MRALTSFSGKSPAAKPGFLLLEVLLGIAIFVIFAGGVSMALLYGQENTILAGDRTRGAYISVRSIEGARNIRDSAFSSLTTGQKGVGINGSGVWAFSGTQIVYPGTYTSYVNVSSLASDWVQVTAKTGWKHGYQRAGTATLVTELTDWRTSSSIGNWANATLQGSYAPGGALSFNDVAVAGSYAYVASNYSASAPGITVISLSNLASPSRVSSSFTVGYTVYSVAIRGSRLYALTADPSAELKVYGISSPTTLSAGDLITSVNLTGSSLGRTLALGRHTLYVGSTYSSTAGEKELYAYDVSQSGSLTLTASLDESASVNMIALSGTAAYLASGLDSGELRIIKATSTGGLQALTSVNLSDRTLDGVSIAASGTSAILGTQKGSSIQEFVLFDTGTTGIPSGSGPWYQEGSGSLLGIAMDSSKCYAFLAGDSGRKALQVINMRNKATLSILYSYDSSSGNGRMLRYDLARDRVYLLTTNAFLIFQPGSPPSACD